MTTFRSEFQCPEPNGFFPDPEQCDLYYSCRNGVPEPKLCPDGLLFEAESPLKEKCDYPFNIDRGNREYVRKYMREDGDGNISRAAALKSEIVCGRYGSYYALRS